MATKKSRTSFEIKSTNLALITFVLKSTDMDTLATELAEQFGKQPDYFDGEPIVIDLGKLAAQEQCIDFTALLKEMRDRHMMPFAVINGTAEQLQAARTAGLLIAPETMAAPATQTSSRADVGKEDDKAKADIKTDAKADAKADAKVNVRTKATQGAAKTMFVSKPLRSGQQVYARDADLIITSMVSSGAEVLADGHIHVYAPLRGRVVAGAQGNTEARIFATCFEPELFSIAGVFQTTDKPLPPNILGQAVMVHLENDSLIITPVQMGSI